MTQQTRLYFQKTGILLAVYLTLRFLLPLVLPFARSWLTVAPLTFVQKKTNVPLLSLGIGYILLFLLLSAISIFCGCYLLYDPCCRLLPICQAYWSQFSEYLTWIPESLSGYLAIAMPSALSCLFGVFLYLLSILLFAKDWNNFHTLLYKLPFAAPISHAFHRILFCAKSWLHAQCRIMLIVSLECTIGYYLLHIPAFPFWAILTGLIDALPVFGTGTIFFPWILIVALQKDYTLALWLGLLYLVTWLTRELLEPKLLGDGLGLLPICFLISVISGLKLFGALGLFSGPFGVLLIRELWKELEENLSQKNHLNL